MILPDGLVPCACVFRSAPGHLFTHSERMVNMKKSVSLLAATALLLAAITGAGSMAAADDGITVDGSLTEWSGIAKNPLSVYADGAFTPSADEYSQFAVSADSLYFALKVKDDTNTKDGLVRDHFRLSLLLPDGSIGLFYSDNDGWHNAGDCPSWWGCAEGFVNAVTPDNSHAAFAYQEDGTLTIEGRARLTDAAKAQLSDGSQLKVALQYFDNMACNSTSYDGRRWVAFGTEKVTAVTAADITGTLAQKPEQEVFPYVAVAEKGGADTDIDGEFQEWENAVKYPLDLYDPATGVFVKSEDEYCQFLYTYGQLYFKVYAKDAGSTVDGLIRDHVRFTVFFPDGNEAFYYYDCDNWFEAGAGAWFGIGTSDKDAEGLNAALRDNSNSSFKYENGYVQVEGRINVRDTLKDVFVNGTELKVALEYFDGQTCNETTYNGKRWLKWGTTEIAAVKPADVTGTVTLHDPEYQDTTDMKVEEPTAGTVNKGYTFDADGNMTVTVAPFTGAASYRVNVFDRWDGADGYLYVANRYVDAETTSLTITGLEDGADYGYQVLALDADGQVLAIYPVVNFTANETEVNPPVSSAPQTPAPDDNVSRGDETSGSPGTGSALPLSAAALLGVSAAGLVLLRKKRA